MSVGTVLAAESAAEGLVKRPATRRVGQLMESALETQMAQVSARLQSELESRLESFGLVFQQESRTPRHGVQAQS